MKKILLEGNAKFEIELINNDFSINLLGKNISYEQMKKINKKIDFIVNTEFVERQLYFGDEIDIHKKINNQKCNNITIRYYNQKSEDTVVYKCLRGDQIDYDWILWILEDIKEQVEKEQEREEVAFPYEVSIHQFWEYKSTTESIGFISSFWKDRFLEKLSKYIENYKICLNNRKAKLKEQKHYELPCYDFIMDFKTEFFDEEWNGDEIFVNRVAIYTSKSDKKVFNTKDKKIYQVLGLIKAKTQEFEKGHELYYTLYFVDDNGKSRKYTNIIY